jgi:protein-disulfide isomerase
VAKPTPTKSRAPFLLLLLVVVCAGAGGIYYKTQTSKVGPVTLAPGTPLPTAEGYLEGKPDAPITILEFADFECPGCRQFATKTEPLLRKGVLDAGLANLRYFDFPLPMHGNTMSASLAAACAADQGKFWEMHDMLFEEQATWNTEATTNPKQVFEGFVTKIGLDAAAWNSCFDSQKNLARIEANRAEGLQRGVNGTPTFVIGDQMYFEVFEYSRIKAIIDSLTQAKAAAPAKP